MGLKLMKLVVGLGNPGNEYEETRHNAGFKVIDLLATEYSAQFRKKNHVFRGCSYDYAKTSYGPDEMILLKPLTYMNLSGNAVKAALDWFKINSQDLLIVHDDVSLPLGKIRIQKGGGAGGQHGVESVIENLKGNKSFNRLKVGIGPDPGGHIRHKYVLQTIPEKDRELYIKVLELSKNAIKFLLKHGVDKAANKYNGQDLTKPKKEKKKRSKPDSSKKIEGGKEKNNQIDASKESSCQNNDGKNESSGSDCNDKCDSDHKDDSNQN